MQLDVTQILRNQGEVLNFDREIVLENKEFESQRIEFKEPVIAKGTVKNVGGVLVLAAAAVAVIIVLAKKRKKN